MGAGPFLTPLRPLPGFGLNPRFGVLAHDGMFRHTAERHRIDEPEVR